MREPNTESFYASKTRNDGRVAIPAGVHGGLVVYHLRHESGRSHHDDRNNLVCSVATFWERYK